jgi:Fe-S cluster assembly protein SufD
VRPPGLVRPPGARPAEEKVPILPTFTADAAAALEGTEVERARRAASFERFASMALPTGTEDVWRYSPIDRLDLDAYAPAGPPDEAARRAAAEAAAGLVADLGPVAALATVVDGHLVSVEGARPAGVTVGPPDPSTAELVGSVLAGGDALVQLNGAFSPATLLVDVAAGRVVERPVAVVHWLSGSATGPHPAAFPRTVVRLGRGAALPLVELVAGAGPTDPSSALSVPVAEVLLDDEARLDHLSIQVLGPEAWYVGRVAVRVGRDATLRSFAAGLGAAYDRVRTDVVVDGQGGTSQLRSVYLGLGDQVHDVRTQQDHAAPRTVSDLLCRGAVAGSSRSVYSGLIRMRKGAVRAEAMQTNNNLLLDESAHADSVPNLDIEENDVRCSHASTVGPVDDDQRYYLESRGVRPERATRLIVAGFFEDVIERSPVPAAQERLRSEFAARLTRAFDPIGAGDG